MTFNVDLTIAQPSGVAVSVALYYLLLLAAATAFVQQGSMLPFPNGSFTSHILRTCGHLVLCVFVCSSCWLSLSKFHSSMVVHGTRRDDACSSIPTELWARSLCCTLHQCCYIFACPPQPGNLQQKLSRNVMTMMSKWLLNQ